MYRKYRHNKNVYRLLKQIVWAEQDWKESKLVKPLRSRSYEEQIFDIGWWDHPKMNKPQRTWKRIRKTQFKPL